MRSIRKALFVCLSVYLSGLGIAYAANTCPLVSNATTSGGKIYVLFASGTCATGSWLPMDSGQSCTYYNTNITSNGGSVTASYAYTIFEKSRTTSGPISGAKVKCQYKIVQGATTTYKDLLYRGPECTDLTGAGATNCYGKRQGACSALTSLNHFTLEAKIAGSCPVLAQ